MFNPQELLNTTFEDEFSTRLVPVPVNADGWLGVVTKMPEMKTWQARDGSSSGLKLVITWELQEPELAQELGRKVVTLRDEIMLDLTETGMLDKGPGKNVRLGRLREAQGTNKPGKPWSFSDIVGIPTKV